MNGETLAEEEAKEYQFFMQLKDAFNAVDRDGNAEFQFPEYTEDWKFLNLPGDDRAIKVFCC